MIILEFILQILKIVLFFFKFYFSVQQVLISYLFYPYECIHVNPGLPVHPTTTPTPTFPPWCPYVCSLHLCLYKNCPLIRIVLSISLILAQRNHVNRDLQIFYYLSIKKFISLYYFLAG